MALFGGSKLDHPMADIKAAKALIAELPAGDAVKTLGEITYWLDSIFHTSEFKAEQRYALADLLDQAAKNAQRKLSADYLALERQHKFTEQRLWKTLFDFWHNLGNVYAQCLGQVKAGAGQLKKEAPAATARTLRALTLQIKWTLLRYGPIESRIWTEIGRAYQFAETRNFTDTPVEVYPGAHGQSSVDREFLKALMLSVSSTDGLSALEQEIAERLVAHFSDKFITQPRPTAGCNYFFDLASGQPAARVLKGVANSVTSIATTHFFGAGDALAGLQRLADDIRQKQTIPADVYLGGSYDNELVLTVIEHLALYWADALPERGSQRRAMTTRLAVRRGFQATANALAGEIFDDASNNIEMWIVENVSDGGYGVIIPPGKNADGIRIGGLVGIKPETAKFWGVGVVRRVARDQYQQYRVGIQTLSRAVIPARVSPGASPGGDHVLLLANSPDANGEVQILLRVGSYTRERNLEMQVNGKSYLLMPSALIEGDDDFDWARYRVMQRD